MKLHPLLLVGALLLTLQLSCARPETTETSPAPSPSPTEQAVIDGILKRFEEAVGGQEAVGKITSLRMKGTWELGDLAGTIAAWRKEPHKTLTVIEFPRIGTLKKGFDGESRWVQTPQGTYADNSPQEIAELERDAEVFSAGKIKRLFASMKLENKAWLSGRYTHVIEGTPAKGPSEKLFFDMENGLLVRWDMARRVPNRGIVFVKVYMDDYRDVAGVKMPFNARYIYESFSFRIKMDAIEPNVAIDDDIFKRP